MPVKSTLITLALSFALALGVSSPAAAQVQVGYVTLTPDPGSPTPVGSLLFSYTNAAGVLVSEAGVGTATPVRSGRTFVEEADANMGIALANPFESDASVVLTLRDASGVELGR